METVRLALLWQLPKNCHSLAYLRNSGIKGFLSSRLKVRVVVLCLLSQEIAVGVIVPCSAEPEVHRNPFHCADCSHIQPLRFFTKLQMGLFDRCHRTTILNDLVQDVLTTRACPAVAMPSTNNMRDGSIQNQAPFCQIYTNSVCNSPSKLY